MYRTEVSLWIIRSHASPNTLSTPYCYGGNVFVIFVSALPEGSCREAVCLISYVFVLWCDCNDPVSVCDSVSSVKFVGAASGWQKPKDFISNLDEVKRSCARTNRKLFAVLLEVRTHPSKDGPGACSISGKTFHQHCLIMSVRRDADHGNNMKTLRDERISIESSYCCDEYVY
jgi:hypothetical protein